MKKQYPTVLRGKETGRLKREEVVAAIIRLRAAKDAAAAARLTEPSEPTDAPEATSQGKKRRACRKSPEP